MNWFAIVLACLPGGDFCIDVQSNPIVDEVSCQVAATEGAKYVMWTRPDFQVMDWYCVQK